MIISSGGTPPRQREALFNEYLDIMYRREMAKGRHIIQSEKELLLGLHKYVGYILHEKTTRAEAMASVLPRQDYEKHVLQFLTWHDPFSSPSKRQAELNAITTEAGERLVLIVEPAADVFGFELRSIQEFFAACHLADTSADTAQRYSRFEAIARLPHWRNVALFFVGRVGRNYAGEAANIIEVCRGIDRDVPDIFVHRGGALALELAADRAFGPNRRRQNALLELGVEIFDRHISENRRQQVQDLLLRLPIEDQRDLAIPLLEKKIAVLSSAYLGPLLRTLHRLDSRNRHIIVAFERMAENADLTEEALALYFDLRPGAEQAMETVRKVASVLGTSAVGRVLSRLRLQAIWRACQDLKHAGMTDEFVSQAVLEAVRRGAFSWVRTEERDFLSDIIQLPWPADCAFLILRSMAVLQAHSVVRSAGSAGWIVPEEQVVASDDVMAGRIALLGAEDSPFDRRLATTPLWLCHVFLGHVTPGSASAAIKFFRDLPAEFSSLVPMFGGIPYEASPVVDLIHAAIVKGGEDDWRLAEHALINWGGRTGAARWRRLCDALLKSLLGTPALERSQNSSDFIRSLQENLSTDQTLPDIPVELFPPLVDYAWALAVRSRPEKYAVDSTVFEQAIRHALTASPVPSVLSELAIRLYTDMPHWIKTSELHHMRLGMLTALLDSPSVAGSADLIPIAVRSCLESGEIPNSTFRKACAVVGRNHESLSSGVVRIPRHSNSATFKRLLDTLSSESDSEIREGALVMIRDFSHMHSYDSSLRGGNAARDSRIRVNGFARMHRMLAKSKVDVERNAGLCMFSVRAPRTREDWSILHDAILSCRDQRTVGSVRIALRSNVNSENGRDSAQWISFLEECLQCTEYPPLQALLTDTLDELLASQDQSLRRYEDDFGLPLSTMAP
ncbi:hypothetical protein HW130_14785 [Streptomyces sp. PKU-EA00015]|uniref:hypothetical protein n=1 Tax=Streptomyces sp. PKU-EA00015 TaxID=2748326 RepID=UPI0015A1B11D|nr:hypothetical protein [Streptomyces sp. PKU-EA00015]NWF27515.1 hypothetical protein [Streptomyces sp. PKU-EA00015]